MSIFSPLTTGIYESTDRDPRRGVTVDTFIIHHSADTSQNNVLAAMQPGGRDVSANYSLKDNSLVGVVGEEWRAWTSGSPDDGGAGAAWDRRSITIEVCNSQAGGSWPVSDASFDTLARLIADWAKRYGQPINDDRVLTHQELNQRFGASYPTACPGDLERRKGELLALANHYWATGGAPVPVPSKPKEDCVVKKYPSQDRTAKALAPGARIRAKAANGSDLNIIGAAGHNYDITIAARVDGLAAGDAVQVRALIVTPQDQKASGTKFATFVAAGDGTAAGTLELKLDIDTSDGKPRAVYVELYAPATNKNTGTTVWIDADAWLLETAVPA